jgi:hypothetical protein
MGNKRTGQDFIDYYENKNKSTGKTTMAEKAQYRKEKAMQRNKRLQELMK